MKNLWRLFIYLFLPICTVSMAQAAGKVLLVQSYHAGYSWTDEITAGVKKGLRGTGVQLSIFYMDTKRKTGEAWKVKAGQMAKEKLVSFKPDVVIAADDNAQEYFAKFYVGKPWPEIVFCGVNANPSKYGYPAVNVTGILERVFFIRSMDLLQQIKPEVKTVAVITDNGVTSDAALAYMKTLELPLKVVSIDQPATFSKWQVKIKQYQDTADAIAIIGYQTVKKSGGSSSLSPAAVMAWTMAHNTKPTVGFLDFAVRAGVLCGIAESGAEHGLKAAELALKILGGKKAGDFPITKANQGIMMINLKTAKALGISIPPAILHSAKRIYK